MKQPTATSNLSPSNRSIGSLAATWLMAKLFFRVTLGRKRILWLGLALLIPIAISLWWRFTSIESGIDVFMHQLVIVVLQFGVLGLSLYLGVAAVRDEIEDRTIVYLFARPIHRSVIILGKILSVVLLLSLTLGLSVCLSYLILVSADGWANLTRELAGLLQALGAIALGCLVYTSFFSLLGVLFRHPMILALILGFGVEVVVSNIPGQFPKITMMYYLKSLIGLKPEGGGLLELFLPSINPASDGFLLDYVGKHSGDFADSRFGRRQSKRVSRLICIHPKT